LNRTGVNGRECIAKGEAHPQPQSPRRDPDSALYVSNYADCA